MIPRHLTLKNFLSYREASLDFSGLHVACIAGPNGAGKSSLLEAIGWALWGESRVASEDDIIHQGELEAQVVFTFQQGEQVYRILRSRHRIQGTGLEFQVKTEAGYRVLTQRGVRATQRLICHHLKLDYDTFIHSAYLRQGRADDFLVKRPSDRKQILADLLGLHRYDQLSEQAQEQARQAKAEVTLRTAQLEELTTALVNYDAVLRQQAERQADLERLDRALDQARQQQLEGQQQVLAYQRHQEQLQLYQQQHHHQAALHQQTTAALAETMAQLAQGEQVLAEAAAIEAGMQTCQALEAEDAELNQRFQRYQHLQDRHQTLAADYRARAESLQHQRQQNRIQYQGVQGQLQDLARTLEQTPGVEAAWEQLAIAKARLKHLDSLQLQVGPLLQRRQHLQTELQRLQTQLQTRLQELTAAADRLQTQQSQRPPLAANVQQIGQTLTYLEQRRAYQEQVREKGLERRSFVEALQATQRACEEQMAEVTQKLKLLDQPEAICPLCDRPLDAQHRTLVQDRHRLQYQDLQDQLWGLGEQLAVTEREIQVLRQEYRAVEAELEDYGRVLHRQGQLEAQMAAQTAEQHQLQQLEAECRHLQQCLDERQYATDLQAELDQIEATLGELAYDDRDHALARGQVNRLRWADLKRHELTQARRRQRQLMAQAEKLEAHLARLDQQWTELEQSPLKVDLDQVESQLGELNYPLDHHQQVRLALQEAQGWRSRQQALDQARQQQPRLQHRLATLQTKAQAEQQALTQLMDQITHLTAQLPAHPPSKDQAAQLEAQITALQQQRDRSLAELGALTQTCQHLEALQHQRQQKQEELTGLRQQLRICQELAHAFGRKGIQAMMIENLLPQLEAETNQILGRLSGHQLHVRFATQRASKGRQPKSIETLDILIADAQGTRPYETYSGGEAFRVNFSLRLALARILAQRSGTALQLLIIDEGFGTQDQQGCDRLIAAINAIAPDFSCILVITHIPHFRSAFQTRLDVTKTAQGSHIELAG